MYEVPKFREDRPEVLHDLIAAHPFATLVTFGPDGQGVADLQPEALLDHYDQLPDLAVRLID